MGVSVTAICWACSGTGFHIKTVKPFTYKKCWMCYGHRGLRERIEMTQSNQVHVELTDRGAIYVNNTRITGRATKWGEHITLHSFHCAVEDVVKECLARGHRDYVSRIDYEPYFTQAVKAGAKRSYA